MLSPRNTADAIPPNKEDHTMLLDDLTIVLFTSSAALRSVSGASRYWIDVGCFDLIEGVFRGDRSLGIRLKRDDRETPNAILGRSGSTWPPGRVVPLSENEGF
jgi:hypothetical protein